MDHKYGISAARLGILWSPSDDRKKDIAEKCRINYIGTTFAANRGVDLSQGQHDGI